MAQLATTKVSRISREVYKDFPELKGTTPNIKPQGAPTTGKAMGIERFLLTFKSNITLPNGNKMQRVVRVIADQNGKVIKKTTSK